MLNLSDLTAIIQLGATFNLGCIALSKENSFAKSLSSFFLESIVADIKQNEYLNILHAEIKSINDLKISNNANVEMSGKIDELENQYLSFENRIKSLYAIMRNGAPVIELDNISLFLGFYSIYVLILNIFNTSCYFTISYCIFNIVSLLFVFVFLRNEIKYYINIGTKNKITGMGHKICAYLSISTLGIFLLLSLLLKWLISKEQISDFNYWSTFSSLISVFLPFVGFVFYFFYLLYIQCKINKSNYRLSTEYRKLSQEKSEIDQIFLKKDIECIEPI